MRKLSFILVLILVMSIPLQAYAVESRYMWVGPKLTFSGTTANCEVEFVGNNVSDYIVVTLKLFNGNNLVKQWSRAGSATVSLSSSCTVTKGVTYTLTCEVMVNGTSLRTYSTTKTC